MSEPAESQTRKKFTQDKKITWYRCPIEKEVLRSLTVRNNWRAAIQILLQIGLFITTGILAYLSFRAISAATWMWSVPLTLVALFVHWTQGPFLSYVAIHELGHKTPFKTRALNEFFLRVYSFISWGDFIWFRPSHVKHHQLTVHADYDGEVVLPQKLSFKDWKFWLSLFFFNPFAPYNLLKQWTKHAFGKVEGEWMEHVLPEEDEALRRRHRNWARIVLVGHLALAAVFILTGHWFLIFIFTFGCHHCAWLSFLCGTPQHFGMTPNTPDFRLCCRTFTCGPIPAFFYWNMQYHVEHHMYPAVPFYNLPKLRQALEAHLPEAPHGLLATWKHMLEVHRKQMEDPDYTFVPELPDAELDSVEDDVLEGEAALAG